LFGLHASHHTFIQAPEQQLLDLATDPRELNNLAPAYPLADPQNVSLSATLTAMRWTAEQAASQVDERPMDQATLETLYALGYLAPQEQRVSVAGLDPKEAVRPQARRQRARHALAMGHAQSAHAILTSLVEDVPSHIAAINTQRLLAWQQQDCDAARSFILHSVEIDPSHSRSLTSLGTIELRAGNLDEAEAATQAPPTIVPNHIAPLTSLAYMDGARGDYVSADTPMQAVIDADPNRPNSHQVRGQLAVQQEQWDASIADYTAGFSLAPRHYLLHNLVGLALAYKGDLDGARATLEAARQHRPDGWRVDDNLACVEALASNPHAAVPSLQRLADPGFRQLRQLRQDPDLATLRRREDFKLVKPRMRENSNAPAPQPVQAGPFLVDGDLHKLPPDLRRALGFAPADADADSVW
jgi:Flp pilus assembly protein TadD